MIDEDTADQPLEIKLVSSHDPLNVRAFSGTIFHMSRALQEAIPEIELVRAARPPWFERFESLVKKATRGRHNPGLWRVLNKYFAKRLARNWRGQRVVAITVVVSSLAGELAEFLPVIHISDATFDLMRNFYANVACLSDRAAAGAEQAELKCISRAAHNSFSSTWAANSAVAHYGARKENVSAISWGCNISDVSRDQMRAGESERATCKLLFLGADWGRKGGDVVCATAEILRARGTPVQVDLVGSAPPQDFQVPAWVQAHGFLSKSNREQVNRLTHLIRDADFLFLPTHQDCTPMVFAEANAYGTPGVTRDVGGVADVVRDGRNGIVLPLEATPTDFADAIEDIWKNPLAYNELRLRSRQEYEERLNWTSWASRIARIVRDLERSRRI